MASLADKWNAKQNQFNKEIRLLLRKHWKWLVILLITLGLLLFFKKFLIMIIFLGINVLIAFLWLVFGNRCIGIEFVLFTSIVSLYAFSLKAALFILIVSLLLHNYITISMSLNSLLNIPIGMICLGIAALLKMGGMDIIVNGITTTIIFNVIFGILVLFLKTGGSTKRIIYFITNLAFNWLLFTTLGPPLVSLLA